MVLSYTSAVSYAHHTVNSGYESYRINPSESNQYILLEGISSHIHTLSNAVSNSSSSSMIKTNYLKECAVKYKPFLAKCDSYSNDDIKKMSNKEIKNVFTKTNNDYYSVYNYDACYTYDVNNYSNYSTYNYDGTKNY